MASVKRALSKRNPEPKILYVGEIKNKTAIKLKILLRNKFVEELSVLKMEREILKSSKVNILRPFWKKALLLVPEAGKARVNYSSEKIIQCCYFEDIT